MNKHQKEPAYLQLYKDLRNGITEGRFSYGSRLPSKRMLAAENEVSVITAEHALDLLCEEGYAESRLRSGTYVIYREADFLSGMDPGKHLENGVNQERIEWEGKEYAGGISSMHRSAEQFSLTVLSRTIRKVLLDYGERILEKCPPLGCPELREAICDYLYRSRNIRIHPGQVVIGAGAEYLYGLIAQFFGKGTVIALENPSYHKIRQVYESFGLSCHLLPMENDGISLRELDRTEAGILHVTPFHSYPSTITASVSKKKAYLRWAARREGYVIEDNYDSELTVSRKAEEPLFSMTADDNVIYLNTFSKTIAPSLRVGYMILPERLLEPFVEKLGFYSCTVPMLEQYLLTELLESGDYERHINRVRRMRRKNMDDKMKA